MEDIQIELKKWLSDYCGNVQEYEYQVRTLINQNENLTTYIKAAYSSQNIEIIQEKIEDFLIEKKIWIETCNNCKKVNYISKPKNIYNRKCEQCSHSLFKETEENDNSTPATKKCIYCNTPIFPPNTMTCFSHNNVGFKY
ncbi:hypothetical protein [Sporosarcina psychrophila]|uniref:hypothetical protein n=1 Tax=Sporosarcina psychrophila TaxID=1476 RepID=UPI0030CF7DF6